MTKHSRSTICFPCGPFRYRWNHGFGPIKALLTALVFFMLAALPAFAQDPGSNLGTSLQTMFSGPLIIGLSTVGIVIGGCLVIFGGGMAIRALGSVLLGAILILDAAKLVSYIQTVI